MASDGVLDCIRKVFAGTGGFNSILCDAQTKKIEQLDQAFKTAELKHAAALSAQQKAHAEAKTSARAAYNQNVALANGKIDKLTADLKTSEEIVRREKAAADTSRTQSSASLRAAQTEADRLRREVTKERQASKDMLAAKAKKNSAVVKHMEDEHLTHRKSKPRPWNN